MENPTLRSEKPEDVVERNIQLTGELMRYLLEHPQLFQALPNQFELVILPDDDPEMRLYNLELLDKYCREEKPVVFVRMPVKQNKALSQEYLSLYAPVAA